MYWPRSDWVHLNELCVRDSVVLEHRRTDDAFVITFQVDDEVSVATADAKAAYSMCKQRKLAHFSSQWKEKDWQGRIVREGTDIDQKLSNAYLNNVKLRDSLVCFVVRGRLQLLQCNSLMALYYPNECTRPCALCNHPTETESHVLNGCPRYQLLYTARHNRVIDVVASHIPSRDSLHVIKDTCLSPSLFGSEPDTAFTTRAVRPDLVIIDRTNSEVFLVEVAVPFDAFVDISFTSKFDKYMQLCLEINALGFSCRTVVLIIGSLGSVHRRVVPGLKMLGLPTYTAKWLAKYLSIGVMIGSHRVWQKRCGDLHV